MTSMFIEEMIGVSILGSGYAAYNYCKVKKLPEGTKRMSEIADYIRKGANEFLWQEYKMIGMVVVTIAILLGTFIQISSSFSYMLGAFLSGLAGFCGMQGSTHANVRVTNTARESKSIGKTLKVALRGGSIMGLCVGSFVPIGVCIVIMAASPQIANLGIVYNQWGIPIEPFTMTIASFVFGCSTIAIFNRVGGGIYTKAADMGADLVGKAEKGIPEDDPRNPAVIADCVGDNVGDTAGLGSDLLESYAGGIGGAMMVAVFLFLKYSALGMDLSYEVFLKLLTYPLIFSGIGLFSCIISLVYFFNRNMEEETVENEDENCMVRQKEIDPKKMLNSATLLAAELTAFLNLIMTIAVFGNEHFGDLPFTFGGISPYLSALLGIISGISIGGIAEYYTSYEKKPTKKIAEAANTGDATTITQGLATGMKSTFSPNTILGISLLLSYSISGFYGVAMSAVGMLSFITVMVAVDTYGPISDNAGGIAEMSELGSNIRDITDKLDSVGNTTAAVGKGFSIGSAAFAAVSLMVSYLYSYLPIDANITLDLMNPFTLAGTIIGASIPYYFSGLLIEAVTNSAQKMVIEVRRQFKEIAGLMEGKSGVKPDYERCIAISTKGSLAEMRTPAFIAVAIPIISCSIFGPDFLAGVVMGATISSIMLAIFTGNAGGAWDNAKKYVESLNKKGTAQHKATVVGDTVGDPLKDTVGPSLNILDKIVVTVANIIVPIFATYNLASFVKTLFN